MYLISLLLALHAILLISASNWSRKSACPLWNILTGLESSPTGLELCLWARKITKCYRVYAKGTLWWWCRCWEQIQQRNPAKGLLCTAVCVCYGAVCGHEMFSCCFCCLVLLLACLLNFVWTISISAWNKFKTCSALITYQQTLILCINTTSASSAIKLLTPLKMQKAV